MNNQNWDYSIQMFLQCVRLQPDNLLFRQTLRGVEKKKYNGNKTGAKMAGMKLVKPKGRIKKARIQKNWGEVDKAAEDGLAINPWEPQLNADLGDAARELGHVKIAEFAYDEAAQSDPNNAEMWRSLAEICEERGDFVKATGCWEKVCNINPMDGEARSRAQAAATKQVIKKGDYEHAESTRDTMAPHEVAKRLNLGKPGQVDGPGQSEEADLQRELRKEPDNPGGYIKLGEFYRRNNKLEEARNMFEKATELSGNSADMREMVEDVELDLMRRNVSLARENAGDDEGRKKQVQELQREMLLRETEVLRNRVERYPQDLRIKFRLGKCFMEDKKFAQAIPLFQQASQDNRQETKALAMLGKCFMQEKKFPLAKHQYERAAPKISAHDNPDLFKDVYYWLGRLCEASGDLESAEKYYSEVLVVDYEYRDTLQRLEKIQAGE